MDSSQLLGPELAAALAAITDDATRRAIAHRAAADVAARTGLIQDDEVREVLPLLVAGDVPVPAGAAERIEQLAERYDEDADSADHDGDEERQAALFHRARAATAVAFALSDVPDGMVSEVLYEAVHALDGDESQVWPWLDASA